jgi:hypothetical protein
MANYQGTLTYADMPNFRILPLGNDILYLDRLSTPILTMLIGTGKVEPSDATKFEWPEGNYKGISTTINNSAGYNTSATSIVVDDASIFTAGDTCRIKRTGELMRISVVDTSTNTLTVTRGIGNSGTGISIVDGDYVVQAGTALKSGDTAPDSNLAEPDMAYNYIQTFSTTVDFTDSRYYSDASALIGTKEKDFIAAQGYEHARKMEASLLLGKRDVTTVANKKVYTSNGLLNTITTNVDDNGGALTTITKANFDAWLADAMNYSVSGGNKKLFVGDYVLSALQKWTETAIQQTQPSGTVEQRLGLNSTIYVTPFGNLDVIRHPLLSRLQYADYAIVLDIDAIKIRTLHGDTELRMYIQDKKEHTIKHEYLTYYGWEIQHEKAHGYIYNISGGA